MPNTLHITSGDCAGEILAQTGIAGEILIWHDVLYDGPREPGWPDDTVLQARAEWLSKSTGGGLEQDMVYRTLQNQYAKLKEAVNRPVLLWFDACLFDISMLVHILACLKLLNAPQVDLIVVDKYPGIEPYNGLGELTPARLGGCITLRKSVNAEQFALAVKADAAFAVLDISALKELALDSTAALPWLSPAVERWLQEQPDSVSGLGFLETLALEVIRTGVSVPQEIFKAVADGDTPPQYWGDTTLWAKINGLADKKPPLVQISGPAARLPLWASKLPLNEFRVLPV